MDEKAKQARAAYQKKWRQENPDKVRRIFERYWTKKAEEREKEQASGLDNCK